MSAENLCDHSNPGHYDNDQLTSSRSEGRGISASSSLRVANVDEFNLRYRKFELEMKKLQEKLNEVNC